VDKKFWQSLTDCQNFAFIRKGRVEAPRKTTKNHVKPHKTTQNSGLPQKSIEKRGSSWEKGWLTPKL